MNLDAILSQLREKELTLPEAPAPAGSYVPCTQVGTLVFVSGVLSMTADGQTWTGKVGEGDRDVAYGYRAAQACALNALAVLERDIGLAKIKRIVQVTGYVNGVDGFPDSPAVINGASELLLHALGEAGKHTRAAVSVNGLPKDASVEIALICEIG